MMKLVLSIFLIVICFFARSNWASAVDMYGNPTDIGKQGQFEIQLGGGNISLFKTDISPTRSTTQIGSMTSTQNISASTNELKESQAFMGVSYTFNDRAQFFVNFGAGKNGSQQSNSRGIGLRLSPESKNESYKMGLVIRAQKINVDNEGLFSLSYPYNNVTDGVNNYYFNQAYAYEKIEYSRIDLFWGVSRSTGEIRPYAGLALSKISGTYSLSINDTATVYSYPVGGGSGTSSTQAVQFNTKSDISGSNYFSGVLGISINPESEFGLTTEIQFGLQNAFLVSGNMKF